MAKVIPVHIGELKVSQSQDVFSTVLGSCVSVCIFSKKNQAGGIIHYSLPKRTHKDRLNELKYGDTSITKLIEEIDKICRGRADDLQAKIVGGAKGSVETEGIGDVGRKNVDVAIQTLKKHEIPIAGQDTGGTKGRKLYFESDTGRVRVGPTQNINEKPKKLRVLVVDDSKTIRAILKKHIDSDTRFEVVATAESAEEAAKVIETHTIDVMTLDIHMPGTDGVTFLSQFLPQKPIPTILVSALGMQEGGLVLKGLEIGAVDYVQKPDTNDINGFGSILREKLLIASQVDVAANRRKRNTLPKIRRVSENIQFRSKTLIAIGTSTGGPEALKTLLLDFPANCPPIVITQHIPPVFSKALADRLDSLCKIKVVEGEDGMLLEVGKAIVAPGGKQMGVRSRGAEYEVFINEDPPVNRHKPSVDYLFDSVAKNVSWNTVGVILTGMGADGAKGLLNMKNKGSRTFTQNKESCVVYGMPKVAFEMGASEASLDLLELPNAIIDCLKIKKVMEAV